MNNLFNTSTLRSADFPCDVGLLSDDTDGSFGVSSLEIQCFLARFLPLNSLLNILLCRSAANALLFAFRTMTTGLVNCFVSWLIDESRRLISTIIVGRTMDFFLLT